MTLQDSNQRTIYAYDTFVEKYIEQTPSQYTGTRESLKKWIDTTLLLIKANGKVFEIGSATPRDARYIRSQGFAVQCSDATPRFVEYLKDMGEAALLLDITKEQIQGEYNLVFANAVFPHFSLENTVKALVNIKAGLAKDGIIAFNVKQGEGEEWIDEKFKGERFIHYWHPHEIYNVVKSVGFDVISLEDGIEGERPTHIWTRIVAQKTD